MCLPIIHSVLENDFPKNVDDGVKDDDERTCDETDKRMILTLVQKTSLFNYGVPVDFCDGGNDEGCSKEEKGWKMMNFLTNTNLKRHIPMYPPILAYHEHVKPST